MTPMASPIHHVHRRNSESNSMDNTANSRLVTPHVAHSRGSTGHPESKKFDDIARRDKRGRILSKAAVSEKPLQWPEQRSMPILAASTAVI